MAVGIGCARGPQAEPIPGQGASQAPRPPKVLTIAIQREPTAFVELAAVGGSSSGGAVNVQHIAHDDLVVEFEADRFRPQLAAEMPSIAAGTWRVNPDGSMDLTWKLRPNIKWHDGAPFTSADVLFSVQVIRDPDVPVSGTERQWLESATATDPLTFVVRWSRAYVEADQGIVGAAIPQHLLADLYLSDKPSFLNSSRFAADFIGLGPYRVASWVPGSHLEFARFDDYYRGRPPLDTVYVRFIGDPNTMVANILAGTVDALLPFGGPDLEQALELRRRWEGTGNQVRADPSGVLRLLEIQYRPDVARPRNGLATNIPVRRALYHAIDRQTLTDVVTLGLAPPADSYYQPGEDLRSQLDIPQYPHDPARAQEVLAQGGWIRGPDGVLVNSQTGERFEVEIWGRSEAKIEKEMNVIADGWKAVGAQVGFHVVPAALQADREYQSLYPAVLITEPSGNRFYKDRLHSSIIPSASNRWSGFNRGGYTDPRVDSLLERLNVTIDPRDRLPLHRQLLDIQMGEVVTMPLYWTVVPVITVKGVKGHGFVHNNATWDFFDWDKE